MESPQKQLNEPSKLEKSTLSNWRDLFKVFWAQCGYASAPPPGNAEAYWERLQDYPEKILLGMFDHFIGEEVKRCPPVHSMVVGCKKLMNEEWAKYRQQLAKTANQVDKAVDSGVSKYEKAVRDAVFALFKIGCFDMEKRKEAVMRVAKEYGEPPILSYLRESSKDKVQKLRQEELL